MEDAVIRSPENIARSVSFLTESLDWDSVPSLPTSACFNIPAEDHTCITHDWTLACLVAKEEFHAQIIYDLATLYFYRQDYAVAKQYFLMCLQNFQKVSAAKNSGFIAIDADTLRGYLSALDGGGGAAPNLTQQLHSSVVNQYTVSFDDLVW